MKTRNLSAIAYDLWRNRCLGSASPVERRFRRSHLMTEAVQFMAGNLGAKHHQRENLNRRQKIAERQGVSCLNHGQIFGLSYALKKWN